MLSALEAIRAHLKLLARKFHKVVWWTPTKAVNSRRKRLGLPWIFFLICFLYFLWLMTGHYAMGWKRNFVLNFKWPLSLKLEQIFSENVAKISYVKWKYYTVNIFLHARLVRKVWTAKIGISFQQDPVIRKNRRWSMAVLYSEKDLDFSSKNVAVPLE